MLNHNQTRHPPLRLITNVNLHTLIYNSAQLSHQPDIHKDSTAKGTPSDSELIDRPFTAFILDSTTSEHLDVEEE